MINLFYISHTVDLILIKIILQAKPSGGKGGKGGAAPPATDEIIPSRYILIIF